jgi:hypothetical protein
MTFEFNDFNSFLIKAEKYSPYIKSFLMIEIFLKAYYVQEKEKYPPYIHNLLRLAEISQLELSDSHKSDFATITAFNINVRLISHSCNI